MKLVKIDQMIIERFKNRYAHAYLRPRKVLMRRLIQILIFGSLPLNFMTIPDFDECFEEGHVSLLSILYLVLNSL